VRLVNPEERQAHVLVPDDQLSLAIGKEGQNVRLAARLTGWKIDIKDSAKYDYDAENQKIAALAEERRLAQAAQQAAEEEDLEDDLEEDFEADYEDEALEESLDRTADGFGSQIEDALRRPN